MNFKEVYATAKSTLADILGSELMDFRLEQVKKNKAEDSWDVVVSYLLSNINISKSPLSALASNSLPYERVYKQVKINEEGVAELLIYKKD